MKVIGVLFFVILFISINTGFCAQKAKVLTETGKKWDVVFLRMHEDTIYLEVTKPDGKPMNVSGHKSKFKKVDFIDGTSLDFSLSNYPMEYDLNLSGDIGDWQGAGKAPKPVEGAGGPQVEQNTGKKAIGKEDSSTLNRMPLVNQLASKPLSSFDKKLTADSIAMVASTKDLAETGALYVQTKPGLALLYLDGKPIEGTTPITVRGLSTGKHGLRVDKDSLHAFSLVTIKANKTINISLSLKKEKVVHSPASTLKKGHGLAWTLCLSSVAVLAGSAASYYLSIEDQKNAQDAKDVLNKSAISGDVYNQNLEINQKKSDDARLKSNISGALLGLGLLDLGLGIVFFF